MVNCYNIYHIMSVSQTPRFLQKRKGERYHEREGHSVEGQDYG